MSGKLRSMIACTAAGALVALATAPFAASSTPPITTWAGLTRQTVAGIARHGANEYTKLGAGPVDTTLERGTFQGHHAWIVKATFTCAGGHHPTIAIWSARTAFKPSGESFMCRGARGLKVRCRELSVC